MTPWNHRFPWLQLLGAPEGVPVSWARNGQHPAPSSASAHRAGAPASVPQTHLLCLPTPPISPQFPGNRPQIQTRLLSKMLTHPPKPPPWGRRSKGVASCGSPIAAWGPGYAPPRPPLSSCPWRPSLGVDSALGLLIAPGYLFGNSASVVRGRSTQELGKGSLTGASIPRPQDLLIYCSTRSPKPSDLTLSTTSLSCGQDPGSVGASGLGWLLRLQSSPVGRDVVSPKAPLDVVHIQAHSGGHCPNTGPGRLSVRPPAGQLTTGQAASLENQHWCSMGRTGAGVLTSSWKGRPIPCTILSHLEATHGPSSLRAGMTPG